jgi:hypothetical protein
MAEAIKAGKFLVHKHRRYDTESAVRNVAGYTLSN